MKHADITAHGDRDLNEKKKQTKIENKIYGNIWFNDLFNRFYLFIYGLSQTYFVFSEIWFKR